MGIIHRLADGEGLPMKKVRVLNRRSVLTGVIGTAVTAKVSQAAAPKGESHIVVTGDLGVVGRKLLPVLNAQLTVDHIVGIDRKRGSHEDLSTPYGEWADKLVDAHAVIHLAWEIPWGNPNAWDVTHQQAAVNATLNLFQACRAAKVPLIVFSSSMGIYLKPDAVNVPLLHGPVYAAAKRFAEDMLQVMAIEDGTSAVSVRLSRVSPPGSDAEKQHPDDDLRVFIRALAWAPEYYGVLETKG